jgi:carbonic anhydrase/acetyltransferase-like protein (isoleucine patch superfamily)
LAATFTSVSPDIDPDSWIAPTASICGDVKINAQCSIWFGTVLRGDIEAIRLGRCCNLQDCAIVHGDPGVPTILEDFVTVGHRAAIHSAHLERGCLIGMGAIVMNGVRIGAGSMVGAGAVVTKSVPPQTLVVGTPAQTRRSLNDEETAGLIRHAQEYWELAIAHRDGKFPVWQQP